MNVAEVMKREVVTVSPGASLKEAAQLLIEHGISGLPVVGPEGQVVGVFSETDVLFKEQGAANVPGWLSWLVEPFAIADREKLAARTVGEAMTAPAETIESGCTVTDAAKRMLGAGINRLPVVDEGVLVGIVTRADLVRAFLRSDAEITEEIRKGVLEHGMGLDKRAVQVRVANGQVTLSGRLDSRDDANRMPKLVGDVPGVVGVESELTWVDG